MSEKNENKNRNKNENENENENEVLSNRHPATRELERWLRPNQNLPQRSIDIAQDSYDFARDMIELCQDGPELTVGLRKLLEAKDCFVRQSIADQEAPSA